MKQKFRKGDTVFIAFDLGPDMIHFKAGQEAKIVASYHEQYGGGDKTAYTLKFKDGNESSWYYEHQLTLVRRRTTKCPCCGFVWERK